MEIIILAFWYFLPAGIGNMTPIFAAKLPILSKWNYPMDAYGKYGSKRILGDHKTVRGLLLGTIAGALTGFVQWRLVENGLDLNLPANISSSLYLSYQAVVIGGLLAFGALIGDAVKSFFKRRVNIASGKSWFPFDQVDYIIGAILLGSIVQSLILSQYLVIILMWFGLHLLTSYIGYLLSLKKQPI